LRTKIHSAEEIFKNRRTNLRLLSRSFPTKKAMAAQIGFSEGLLRQIIGDNSTRTIDETLARKIERKLSIPAGSLDKSKLFE